MPPILASSPKGRPQPNKTSAMVVPPPNNMAQKVEQENGEVDKVHDRMAFGCYSDTSAPLLKRRLKRFYNALVPIALGLMEPHLQIFVGEA
jgi:hypothetical protein